MTGTLINALAIAAGGLIGTLFGARMPNRVRQTALDGLGLATAAIGLKMTLDTKNILIVLGALVLGGIIGEFLNLDLRVKRLGDAMERIVTGNNRSGAPTSGQGQFAQGFVTTSLLVCIGPMAIMGSIQDGLLGDYTTLTVKAVIDGFAALAFGSSLGIGVSFAALPLAVYQGGLTLGASVFQSVLTEFIVAESTATGGVLVFAVGLSMLEIKQIRVANLLPAVFLAPLLSCLASLFR
ncbi:MAG: DUF554 domain-containing protein [Bacillota bacterium]|jgi:uncharacterized membrane protein YqgA involved in biofilm formation